MDLPSRRVHERQQSYQPGVPPASSFPGGAHIFSHISFPRKQWPPSSVFLHARFFPSISRTFPVKY